MISVLVVDDDDGKRALVEQAIAGSPHAAMISVEVSKTYSEAATQMKSRCFDIVILDVLLPRVLGEKPSRSSSEMLLREIFDKRLVQPGRIIGLTAYPTEIPAASEKFAEGQWIVIEFDRSSEAWQLQINSALALAVEGRFGPRGYGVDVCLITALRDPELSAVLACRPPWTKQAVANDDTIYFSTNLATKSGKLRVVASSCAEMGVAAAAAQAMKMVCTFRPRLVIMCGIAAGVKRSFGTVVIPDPCWDWSSGKISTDGAGRTVFEAGPAQQRLDPGIREALREYIATPRRFDQLATDCGVAQTELHVEIGPLSSGPVVVDNQLAKDWIAGQHRKLVGFEMEAYGVFIAAANAPHPKPFVLVAKAICDMGDGTKEQADANQGKAAKLSANVILDFLASAELRLPE